jgi:hypothetical protein
MDVLFTMPLLFVLAALVFRVLVSAVWGVAMNGLKRYPSFMRGVLRFLLVLLSVISPSPPSYAASQSETALFTDCDSGVASVAAIGSGIVQNAGLTSEKAAEWTDEITFFSGIGAALTGADQADVIAASAIGGSAFQNNYLTHAEEIERSQSMYQCQQGGNQQACDRFEELQKLDANRDAQLRQCVGNYSQACTTLRAHLTIATAEYIEIGHNTSEFDRNFGYALERKETLFQFSEYTDANDEFDFSNLAGRELHSDLASEILSGYTDQITKTRVNMVGAADVQYLAAEAGSGMFVALPPGIRLNPRAMVQMETGMAVLEEMGLGGGFAFGPSGALRDANATNSVDDVGDLFRGDGRPADEIFEGGLTPWDADGNLELDIHVNTSPSPQTGNQWVSTSTDVDVATDFANQNGGNVYVIDGNTPNGVDVDGFMQDAGIPQNFGSEAEIAFPGGVRSCNIQGCFPTLPNGDLGDFVPNPNYTGGN